MHEHFTQMTAAGELFHANVSRDQLWDTYLGAFPPGTNPVFRQRTEHDCSCCRQFVKGVGGMVSIAPDGSLRTIWDVDMPGHYGVVAARMAALVRGAGIDRVYRSKEPGYGTESNVETVEGGHDITWHHFHCKLPSRVVVPNVGTVVGTHAAAFQVLRRGLQDLTVEALDTVEDLIASNSLYRGEEHLAVVQRFASVKRAYDAAAHKDTFVWGHVSTSAARFRNTAIGTLVQDLSGGMGIEQAVRRFEVKVAPQNYQRTSSPITKGMVDNALKTLRGLGLEGAVHRRLATIGDVSPADVLFVDRSVQPLMKDGLADLLMEEVKPQTRSMKGAVDITADAFFADVLPGAEGVEMQLAREHLGNFVTLTAPKEPSTGRLFKWDNDFAWVYDGNVTDSIKDRVKAAGGRVVALMRVSLSWYNGDDLDIHARDPKHGHIHYARRCGVLDVDMNAAPSGTLFSRNAVENLAWQSLVDGQYEVWVHQYAKRESVDVGFEIEYAYGHDVRQATYPKAVQQGANIPVCTITVQGGKVAALTWAPGMVGGEASTEKWGVPTGQMVPVDSIMLSPNHWGPEDRRTGNRHHIFVLRGCKTPDRVRGFFNEYLRSDLHGQRKVFEVLAGKLKCETSGDQLSGVGFSSTRRASVIIAVRKDGTTRTYNVQF